MAPRSRTRQRRTKQERFLLDHLPKEVRENIARIVTKGGQCNADGYNLSQASKHQRHAVLSAMPRHMNFALGAINMTDDWAKLLSKHVYSMHVEAMDANVDDDEINRKAPIVQLLTAPQLQKVHIPAISTFLFAIRSCTSLRVLSIDLRVCDPNSLICSLRHFGPSLGFLGLTCGNTGKTKGAASASNCPMLLCNKSFPGTLDTLCPNLKHLRLRCPHIEPSTASTILAKLPGLRGMDVMGSGGTLTISSDDISALRRLQNVCVENVSNCVDVASRIGNAVTSCFMEDDLLDNIKELIKCPRLQSARFRMQLSQVKQFVEVASNLPLLKFFSVLIQGTHDKKVTFTEVKDAALETKNVLRSSPSPTSTAILECAVFPSDWMRRTPEMARIVAILTDERTRVTYSEVSVHLMPHMRVFLYKTAPK
ncbi:unnamed protein product [Chondrus crispus]|uniref:F-box domain-containing protein n=1 Tax=Chondrus crispus TaxID=2769 RepID=R7Q437_CHOCR|nr:unnamed protein product [Chondrus crispus]CDF33292.1 unnamed protein product [Chondrus crispus]|eukprot:XP_005713095.1 unnamed protein product [Chondrus crispus]